jgi:ribonuclease BN (tRNA processing enzyme)
MPLILCPRNTTASLLKALGVPAKDAQVILGHAHLDHPADLRPR